MLQDKTMPHPCALGSRRQRGRDGDRGSGTAALGNISLHLSNETKPRENTHEKEGKEKLLGEKIKVLPSKMLSCSYEETQIALIAAAARRVGAAWEQGLAMQWRMVWGDHEVPAPSLERQEHQGYAGLPFGFGVLLPHSHRPMELGSDVQVRSGAGPHRKGEQGLQQPKAASSNSACACNCRRHREN